MRDDGEAACDVAAAAAVDDMERGVADDVCGVEVAAWVVCLLGCWADAPAAEREAGVCLKAAKKVERKKGRCDDMVSFRGGTRGKVVFRGRMVSWPSRGLEFSKWRGRSAACGPDAIFVSLVTGFVNAPVCAPSLVCGRWGWDCR